MRRRLLNLVTVLWSELTKDVDFKPDPRRWFHPPPYISGLVFLPASEQLLVLRQARRRAFVWWQWGALYFFTFAAIALSLAGLRLFGTGFLGVATAVGGALGSIILVWGGVVNRRLREQVTAELSLRGVCFNCGYDLRATPERCPECGARAGADAGTSVYRPPES